MFDFSVHFVEHLVCTDRPGSHDQTQCGGERGDAAGRPAWRTCGDVAGECADAASSEGGGRPASQRGDATRMSSAGTQPVSAGSSKRGGSTGVATLLCVRRVGACARELRAWACGSVHLAS